MRIGMILGFVGTFNLAVLVPAVRADVIPTRIATSEEREERAQVEARLNEIGLNGDQARGHVDRLLPDDVSQMAARPDSLQMVSGLWFEEWIIGLGFAALILFLGWRVVAVESSR